MKQDTELRQYVATITAELSGFTVACSCGYLATEWPTMAVALADETAHIRQAHFAADDAE